MIVDNYTFLSTIFGPHLRADEAIGSCAFTESPDKRNGWQIRTPQDPNHAALMTDKAHTANTYFCISSVKRQTPLSRAQGSVSRLFVVPLDDVGTGVGSKVSPESIPLEPTYKIETSEGNFQYGYVLALPMEDLARAGGLIKALAKNADEGGSMVAKLMRLPVGINNKEKYAHPQEVQIWGWKPERRFTEDQLIDAFGVDREWLDSIRLPVPGESGGEIRDDLYDWLLAEGFVIGGAPDARGWVAITCPWHDEHTGGNDTAAFSPMGLGGPTYQDTRQFKCMHSHCADRSWIDIARLMFVERFALGAQAIVYDTLKPGYPQKIEHFRHWAAPYNYSVVTKTGKQEIRFLSDEWRQSRSRLTVDREGFHPRAPRMYRDVVSGDQVFNTFSPMPAFQPTKARDRIEPILDQLQYLFKEEYENALSFLAHTVHRPETRIQFAMLHISTHHGTGRGWLKQLLALLVGQQYIKSPTLQDFVNGQFNEWLYQSLVCVFDEVRQKSVRFAVQDKVRELITEPRMLINRKFMPKIETDIYCNIIFLSNHMDALQTPDEDRRLWMLVNFDPPKDAEWYTRIYDALADREALRQFYWFLQDYLATPFNPLGRAPVTAYTAAIRNAGKSELEVDISDLVGKLRSVGVRVMYKPHFLELCRAFSVPLPVDMYSRTAGGSPKERAMVWAVLADIGVMRLGRVRPSKDALSASMPSSPEITEMLALDAEMSTKEVSEQKSFAEAAATNRFLVASLEKASHPRRNLL